MKQRLEFIDASKALAILLVIVGHCYWKSSLSIATPAIYSFHMPLFFIISGMFIKALSIKESLLKYSKNYLKSYFVGGVLCLIFNVLYDIVNGLDFASASKDVVIALFFCKGSVDNSIFGGYPAIGPLWFLFALFWGCLIVSSLKKYINSGITQFLIVILLFAVSYVTLPKIRLPLCIQLGMSCSLYIWIGSMIKQYDLLNIFEQSKLSIVSSLLLWALSIYGGSLYMNAGSFGLGLISIIASVCATLLVFCAFKKTKFNGGWIGRNTLVILCVHSAILYSLTIDNPMRRLSFHPILNYGIEIVIQVGLSLALSYALSYIPIVKYILKIH